MFLWCQINEYTRLFGTQDYAKTKGNSIGQKLANVLRIFSLSYLSRNFLIYLILLSQFVVLKRQFPNKFIFCLQHAFFYYRSMEEIILRFPHLAEKIFQKLTNEGLAKSREVERLWQKFIDERSYPWLRIVNIPTILQDGDTYMHLAAQYGQTDIFEMILSEEDNKNPKNGIGNTAFHLACSEGCMNIAIILINKSNELAIDLNSKNNHGWTAFHLACVNGGSEITEMLIKNAAIAEIDLNIKGNGGRTAFHVACVNGHSEVAEMIIKNAASAEIDLNSKNNYGLTGFHEACFKGHSETVEVMMKNAESAEIDLNSKDKDGWTAFHKACRYGNSETVEVMMKNAESLEIDLEAKNNDNKTGYQLTKKFGRTHVVNLIETMMQNLAV